MSFLHLDFESCSTDDLKRSGAVAYSQHPDTQVLCMAWAFDNEPPDVWIPGAPFPSRILDHVAEHGVVCAWNAEFEHSIWNNVLPRHMTLSPPPLFYEQMHDTMARAAIWGLPLKLEQAAIALNAPHQKSKIGHALMLRMSKPRSWNSAMGLAGLVQPKTPVWWHDTDPAKYIQLQNYCVDDVLAERGIGDLIPAMPAYERDVWLMDRAMNTRGLMIDRLTVSTLHHLAKEALDDLDERMRDATSGLVPATTNVAKILAFVQNEGVSVDSLKGEVIEALLASPGLTPKARTVLTLRNYARKTSTKKLKAMADATCGDERIRGLFQYAGAGRTLRWAGRLVQPQNLPRPMKGLDVESALHHMVNGADPHMIREFWGEPLDVIASCLRGCFIPAKFKKLISCDFSQIEARVVAWLAGQDNILDIFRDPTKDIYVYTAGLIGSTDRQLGKVLVLACGFGMGGLKFAATALTYGITLDQSDAIKYVMEWRAANAKIKALWYDAEDAARQAILNPGQPFDAGKLQFIVRTTGKLAGAMTMHLPSGHFITYRDADLQMYDGREQICFMGVDQQTRQWTPQRTYGGKLIENATQSVARHLMADAMLRMRQRSISLVGTVHDEIIAEEDEGAAQRVFSIMHNIMCSPPAWAQDLPLAASGWVGDRYRKG